MHQRLSKAAISIAAAWLVLMAGPAWGIDPPHPTDCSACHVSHGSPGLSLTSVAGNANLCISCHNPSGAAPDKPLADTDRADPYGETDARTDYQGTSHAWGVAAVNPKADADTPTSSAMASRLDNGNITCSVCHDQHNHDDGTPYLRTSNVGNAMCIDCHSARDVTSSTLGSHPVGVAIPGTGPYKSPTTLQLDGGNVECTTCHSPHYATSGGLPSDPGDGYLLDLSLASICTDCHDFGAGRSHFDVAAGALWPGGQYGTDYARVTPGGDILPSQATGGTTSQGLPSTARGACINCHWPHGWEDPSNPGTEYATLLVDKEENLCYTCHDGGPASTDIMTDFSGTATDVRANGRVANTHHDVSDADQAASGAVIECSDCHNPHLANSAQKVVTDPDPPPDGDGRSREAGTIWSGSTLMSEWCLACHDNSFPSEVSPPTYALVDIYDRWVLSGGGDKADQHGAESASNKVSLRAGSGYARHDTLQCTDCHEKGHGASPSGETNLFLLKTTIYSKDGSTPLTADGGSTTVRVTDLSSGNTDALTNGKNWCSACHPDPMGGQKDKGCLGGNCHQHGLGSF